MGVCGHGGAALTRDQPAIPVASEAVGDRSWPAIAVAIGLGIALGVFSLVGDALPDEAPTILLNGLANATALWTLTAFASGLLVRRVRRGALAGALALVFAVLAYYVAFRFVWGDRLADVRIQAIVWLVAAIVAGSIIGAAGGLQARPDPRHRALGLALVGGALVAEAVYFLVQLQVWNGIDLSRTYLVVAVFDLVVAAIIPVVLGDRGYRALVYLGSLVLAIGGFVALNVIVSLAVAGAYLSA
jgi:hypothetical protein